jgi:hypothetical protein
VLLDAGEVIDIFRGGIELENKWQLKGRLGWFLGIPRLCSDESEEERAAHEQGSAKAKPGRCNHRETSIEESSHGNDALVLDHARQGPKLAV